MRRPNLTSCLAIAALLLALASVTAARVIYVDADATGANNGSSWADAYSFLQDALADANLAEKPVEIRVAQGIYKPDQSAGITPGDRVATFQLINDVAIRGGYAGSGEPDPNARDIEKYKTILSGDLADNDVDVNRPCDLLTEPSREENSYHVLICNGCDEKAVLDGITISAGNANRDFGQQYLSTGNREFIPPPRFDPTKWGGGMYNDGGSPMIINCTFSSNSSQYGGGSLYNRARSSPTLVNCTFNGNRAGRSGGGIHNCGYSDPTLTNCTFSENSAGWSGGGMHNEDSSPRLINCAFIANSAMEEYGRGGGMDNYVSDPILTNCTFIGNSAGWVGGGVVNTGPSSNTTLTDCTFSRNSASNDGGGMYSSNSVRLTLTNCTFSGNLAGNLGGGMYNGSGEARLTNCMLSENSATWGGGVYHDRYGRSTLANCTISDNRADRHGGGLCCGGADLTVINCILWGDTATQGHEIALLSYEICYPDGCGCMAYASSITVSYSDVQVGPVGVYVEPGSTLNWGMGNIDADPNFGDVVDGDYRLKSQAGRWDPDERRWTKDEVTSPCIDAGDRSTPIGNEPFPNGGTINMGAYGGTAEASKSYFGEPVCETIIAGDINGDCTVNFKDFALMAAHWLEDNTPINSDSVVKEGIEYYIRTDKSIYHLGENVEILYRVTNLTENPVDIGKVLRGPWCGFMITDENNTDIWQYVRCIPPSGYEMLHLEASESKQHEITWDMISDNGTFAQPADDYLVGTGAYHITAGLMLSGSYKHKRAPVSVSIDIRP
jgi:predicted outer membrane repeat protein